MTFKVPSSLQIPRFTSKFTTLNVLSDSLFFPPNISFAFNLLYLIDFTFSVH